MSEPVIFRPDDQTVQVTPRAGWASTDHDREVPDTRSEQESATIKQDLGADTRASLDYAYEK
jgi:hypothetical protein